MSSPRIIVLCPEYRQPSGGVRKLYRLVDVLVAHGYPAVIGHQEPGFRYSWFDNATPIAYGKDMWPGPADILVVPEINSWEITPQATGIRKVIFNQNAYQTFLGRTRPDEIAPYQQPDCVATLVVSEDSRDYLQYAFPGHPIFRIHNSIDPNLFHYSGNKSRRIALMTQKNREDSAQVLSLLASRSAYRGFEVALIEGKSESETAAILRDAAVFLSFHVQEGWALPPMEAMACGCITIGYHGRAGREYFTSDNGFPIERDDIVGFSTTIERVLEALDTTPLPLIEKARRASEFILKHYTSQREENDILLAWKQILQLPALKDWADMRSNYSQSS